MHSAPVDSALDDAVLVAAAKRDRQAFSPLYARYAEPVYRYCYRVLGSREAAEDATSLVFTKALAALPTCADMSFRSWLFTIAHNVIADRRRRRDAHQPLDLASELEDTAPTPEEWAIADDEGRRLRRLLASLPPAQRDVVELRLTGLSGPEAARVLGRSHGAVKAAQFRAFTHLRALLGISSGSEETRDV
jgi:RNA polymerase sigma-70 factor (ECF subfamily)